MFNKKFFETKFRIVTNASGGYEIQYKNWNMFSYSNLYNVDDSGRICSSYTDLNYAIRNLETFKEKLIIASQAGKVVYTDGIPVQDKNENKLKEKLKI